MNKFLKIFDKYTVCVWAIVILLVTSITIVPFAPGAFTIFGLRIPLTPILVMLPILMGIVYAILVSYETPAMTAKKKNIFRIVKLITFLLFYVLTIAVIVYAAVKGMIRF